MSELVTELGGRHLTLSNLDKVLFAQAHWTKAEVIDYYLQIAPVMLPHITDRAVTRIRFPDGVGTGALQFYEKNLPPGCPDWIGRQGVRTSDSVITYLRVDDAATLVYLANLAALELHVPQWSISAAPRDASGQINLAGDGADAADPWADRIVVDCDPGPGITMIDSARAAMIIAAEIARDGLLPVVRTSGNKGLQVCAAIAPTRTRRARQYVHTVATRLVARHPDLFVIQVTKAVRTQRIFLDYNQNLATRNTIASYSLRARPHPRVATPVTLEELAALDDPDGLRFGPRDVLARIDEYGDLAADLLIDDPPPLPTDG